MTKPDPNAEWFDPDAPLLVQTAQLVIENIEKHPDWMDSAALVTARAHAAVLAQDLDAALAPPPTPVPDDGGEGDVEGLVERLINRMNPRNGEVRMSVPAMQLLLAELAQFQLYALQAEGRVKELEEGLRPFAELYRQISEDHGDDWLPDEASCMRASLSYPVAKMSVRWGSFRKARSLLSSKEG